MDTSDNDWWDIIKERVRFFSTIVGCILIDSGFVAIWAIIDQTYHKYVVEWLKTWFQSTLINEYVFPGMKIIFDIITLAIVIVFIYVDFRKIARKILEIAKEGSSVKDSGRSKELHEQANVMDLRERETEKSED